jgi:hypothetical protein
MWGFTTLTGNTCNRPNVLSLNALGNGDRFIGEIALLDIYDFLDVPGQGDDCIIPKQDLPAQLLALMVFWSQALSNVKRNRHHETS